MEPILARVQGGADFVAVLSVISVVLLIVTMSLCNTEARTVLTVASSVFVALTVTGFLYSQKLLVNMATFTLVAILTNSFIENFLETTTIQTVEI